jgi:tetratricopeptide (TPR) repeat protein
MIALGIGRRLRRDGLVPLVLAVVTAAASAADPDEAANLFRTGRYEECERQATEALSGGDKTEEWYGLKIRSLLALGKYREALRTSEEALDRHPASLALYGPGREARRYSGLASAERDVQERLERQFLASSRRWLSAQDRVALGQFLLLRGADPKQVLDQCYDAALKQDPDCLEAVLASAELAIAKQDNALAAETLARVPKSAPADPQVSYLTALAFSDSDRAESSRALDRALEINPRHVESLLLRADSQIDSEQDAEAGRTLDAVLAVNPSEPRAWAFRAILAHLAHDPAAEAAARSKALVPWPSNPEVDALIGRKLAQKYRFAEAALAQRQALLGDPDSPRAKIELAETLLRLGEEAEGWKLVDEAAAADPYNVVAYNLATLKDRLAASRTLQSDGLIVRMDPREADLYGDRVLALLQRARSTLGTKYGVTLPDPVIIEVFPRKQEFAVRTFGLPGAEGFLGVCFGRVITALSPAAQGEHPSNWEAVLWHEFCHAVTLTKTRNKMPRWLSEGISVYEEWNHDRAWGERLTPIYRTMILGDDLTPLSRLSGAFLAPKSGLHVQFAYFESALAVAFLVEKSGMDGLRAILDDLGAGRTINESLVARTGQSLDDLDRSFADFARKQARDIVPGASWDEPELPDDAGPDAVRAYVETHPGNIPARKRLAAELLAARHWAEAKPVLEKLRDLDPNDVGPDNAYDGLARIARETSDTAGERASLEALTTRNGDAAAALQRLIELDEAAGNWTAVADRSARLLAVNPLLPAAHRAMARAAEALGRRDEAIAACRALGQLDQTDPAGLHYRLACLLKEAGRIDEARRETLKALEEAPRFLDAHRLLLQLEKSRAPEPTADPIKSL